MFFMKFKIITLIIVFALLVSVAIATEEPETGPAEISIYGGKNGNVEFPHRQHQDNLGDCKICHDIFPKKLGVITALKEQGKLKKKQVMNNCRKCHKEMAKAGKKAGPITCKTCHNK